MLQDAARLTEMMFWLAEGSVPVATGPTASCSITSLPLAKSTNVFNGTVSPA